MKAFVYKKKKDRMLFEKFEFFINLLRKSLGSSSSIEKKNSRTHVIIQK